jgi:hypothetical protein
MSSNNAIVIASTREMNRIISNAASAISNALVNTKEKHTFPEELSLSKDMSDPIQAFTTVIIHQETFTDESHVPDREILNSLLRERLQLPELDSYANRVLYDTDPLFVFYRDLIQIKNEITRLLCDLTLEVSLDRSLIALHMPSIVTLMRGVYAFNYLLGSITRTEFLIVYDLEENLFDLFEHHCDHTKMGVSEFSLLEIASYYIARQTSEITPAESLERARDYFKDYTPEWMDAISVTEDILCNWSFPDIYNYCVTRVVSTSYGSFATCNGIFDSFIKVCMAWRAEMPRDE